jgi:Asp/Glu/hydantoin racemase
MADILVLVHTISPLIQLFDQLCAEMLPGVLVKHILDEPLGEGIRQHGGLVSTDAARLWDHVKMAEAIRARAVLVTCSTISPLVDPIRPLTTLPLVKIDDAMVVACVQAGPHLGLVATNPIALTTVQQRIETYAFQEGKPIRCESIMVPGAFEALQSGDLDTHHRLIRKAVLELSSKVDGIVLAQASMSKVLDEIPERERRAPIFSGPRLALAQVRDLIRNLGWG